MRRADLGGCKNTSSAVLVAIVASKSLISNLLALSNGDEMILSAMA
jgi:hypothetical protein